MIDLECFSKNRIKFLLEIFERGYHTRKTQKIWDSLLAYYLSTWILRNNGLIKEDGFEGNHKRWTLTEKGKKLVKLIKEIGD
jgi:predicted transcriptional regulator